MGSFRPAAGNQHLHWYCNFAGIPIETVPKSLLHSCRSELTRQGISLTFSGAFTPEWTLSSSECVDDRARSNHAMSRSVNTVTSSRLQWLRSPDAWRIVSEDPSAVRFPADCPISRHCY